MDNPITWSPHADVGIYTWDIGEDLVYGDLAVAQLYGFGDEQALAGVPVLDFMEKIHPDDRKRIADLIRDTLLRGTSYTADYRILDDGLVRDVTSSGRCFRNKAGEPTHYAGIIYPLSQIEPFQESALDHCITAHAKALQEGAADAAELLAKALVLLKKRHVQ